MKKVVLPILISCTALSAQAQIFTNDREFTIEVAGAVTAQLIKDTTSDSSITLDLKDAHFNFTPKYTLETGMIAYSDLKVESSNGASGLSEGYVGLDHKGFDLTAGKHSYASGNFGISRSKELGPDSSLGRTSGDNVLKLMYRKENLEIGTSYNFGFFDAGDPDNAFDDSSVASSFDVYVSGMLGDFDADATFQVQNENSSAESESVFYFGYSAYYTLEKFYFGGSLSMDTSADANVTVVEIAGEVTMNKRISFGGGFAQKYIENGGTPTIVYANMEYLFHKEVAGFTEVALDTTQSFGFVSGLTVKF